MAEFLPILNALLAVISQEAKHRKCCSKPGKGFLQHIEHLLLLRSRFVAGQVRLVKVNEIHGAQEGDDHEPEVQAHPGGHKEPSIEETGETKDSSVGHWSGLGCYHHKEGESEEAQDVPDNHAVLNELPKAAGEERSKEVARDDKVENKEAEGISGDVHLPGGGKFPGIWNCEFQILGKCLAGWRLGGFGKFILRISGIFWWNGEFSGVWFASLRLEEAASVRGELEELRR